MNAIIYFSRRAMLAVAALVAVASCAASIPDEALQLSRESLAQRRLQTRIYETGDERFILQASAGVLQDTGFSLDEAETSLGVIVGSKDRSAVEGGQVAAQVAMEVLFGVYQPIDEKQKIRVSLVSHPSGSGRTAVRGNLSEACVESSGTDY
jgi:hypothetical protein